MAAAATLPATGARADDAQLQPEPTVIVTATRVPTPVDEVLAPVVLIDRDTIERSNATDTAELLRFHAGFDLGRNGGPGQPTALFIRGAESNHTLVLVDGLRINPGTIGLPALQNISPDMVERIEVVKGPRSAVWGSDAIGGVVNIVTRRGSQTGWVMEAGYGDYDTRRASLVGGFALGEKADLDLGVSWLDSDGFPTRTGDTVDRGFDNLNANIALRADVGPADVTVRHWRTSGTSEYSDFFLTPVDQDFVTATTAAEVRLPAGEKGEARFAVAHLEDEITQNQSPDFLQTDRNTFEAQYDWRPTGVHALSIGGMYFREKASSESFGEGFEADTDSFNAYVQDSITSGPHSALLALGYTDHETAGTAVTWNAEYGYTFNEARTRVYALAGSGFRAPDATDRFGFGGNANLAPEVADEIQLGLRYTAGAGNTFKLELYRNDIDDLIEFDLGTFELRNIAAAEIRGAELSWDFQNDDFSIRTSIVRQSAENPLDDVRLLRRAEKRMTVNLVRHFGDHRLGMSILASGDREDFGATKLPGYALVNLTGQVAIGDRWRVNAKVENLFDRQYETAAGFRMQELSAFLELRYAWR